MRTRVKICGITRPEDALAAAELGADAIGLVFYPPSPRAVSITQAGEILDILPAFVSSVALFVDAKQPDVERVLEVLPIDLLQFHGDEAPKDCARYGRRYVKAVRMREGTDVQALSQRYSSACGLLLDTYRRGVPGGTGRTFDWSMIPAGLDKPLIIAGGLDPDNVAAVVRSARPYAVDVSGGVEREKGIKDSSKIAAFMKGVSGVNANG